VNVDGRWLVDGGCSSLLPVELAERRGAATIVALPASTPTRGDRRRSARAAAALHGLPTSGRPGSSAAVLDLGGRRSIRWRGSVGFRRTDELVAIGEREAAAALRDRFSDAVRSTAGTARLITA